MPIQITGLSHLALRVTDLARAKRFYAETLGFPVVLEQGDLVLVNAHGVLLGMRGGNPATAPGDRFDPYRVGIDHLALAVADPAALDGLARQLDAAGVRHNGVEDDPTTGGRYISFYDPDGIAWELYFLPSA
jgi:glyoxylase I family protein